MILDISLVGLRGGRRQLVIYHEGPRLLSPVGKNFLHILWTIVPFAKADDRFHVRTELKLVVTQTANW